MPRLSTRVPKYRKHSTGQAYVELGGDRHYLGRYGSAASKDDYNRLIAEWMASGRMVSPSRRLDVGKSVAEIVAAYLVHAKEYYGGTLRYQTVLACRTLRDLYGRVPAAEFGPLALRACRERVIDAGNSRNYTNEIAAEIKRIFNWAASLEMVAAETAAALKTVAGLAKGRTRARETEPVRPVADHIVEQTIPHLPGVVADMIRLQRLTGMRPAEVCIMRPSDIEQTDDVWVYRPESHKTLYRGKLREVAIGPKSQEILRRYLSRDVKSYCFSPVDTVDQWQKEKRSRRKTKVQPSQRDRSKPKPKRKPGSRYTTASYRRAIHRACGRAQVEQWSPNQLRHSMATEVRKQLGLEAAQVALGHAQANVTQVYAERNLALAAEVARTMG